MAAYHRVYDSRHLRLTAKNRDQLRNPTLGNRVWATFLCLAIMDKHDVVHKLDTVLHCCQRKTEQHPQATCRKKLGKVWACGF